MTNFTVATAGSINLEALAKALVPILQPLLTPGVPPVVTPPTPPAAGTFWVFKDGTFKGGGDWSWGNGKVDYTLKAPDGTPCITVIGDEGLQPFFANQDFDTTGFKYVLVSIWPTQNGNSWITGAEMKGDVPIPGAGGPPSIMQYGPNPAIAGQWNTYKIPLSAYGITPGLHILKVMFSEQSSANRAGNRWYVNNFGFSP